jgi:cytoskeletal protein RodZ
MTSSSGGVIGIIGFGQRLRAERERQGFDLEAAAEETKIRKLYLNALEEEDFDQLPSRVYATGFVGSYARFLNMDVDAVVQEFKALAYPVQPMQQPVAVVKRKVRKRIRKRGRTQKIPVKNIFAALLFLVVIWWLGSYLVAYISHQGISKQSAVQTTPASQVTEVVPGSPQVITAPNKLSLIITAQQRCWLQVTVDGVNKYSGTMAVGEQQSFEAQKAININAGNAGGIELTLNGQKLAPLGAVGQVVQKTFDMSSISKE